MALVQRLTNTGILQTAGIIDETSVDNIAGSITTSGDLIMNGSFDEITLSSTNSNYSYFFSSNSARSGGDQGNYLIVTPFNNGFGTSDFTVEFFAKWLSIAGSSNVIVGNWETGATSWQISMSSTLDILGFGCRTTLGIDSVSQSITPLSYNKSHHIAVTRTSGVVKFYVNGQQVYSGTGSSGRFGSSIYPPNANQLFINAGNGSTATNRANCYISNLRIIIGTSLYSSSTLTVPTSPLTAVSGTVLLTCQSASLVDNSGLGRTITSYYSSGFSDVSSQLITVFPPADGVMRRQTSTSYQIYDSFDELSLAYTITPDKTITNEGDTVTYNINSPLIGSSNLYWTNTGSITAADFTGGIVYGVTPLTWAGTATAALWSYTGITPLSTSGYGTGVVFSIRKNTAATAMATHGVLTVIPTSPGSGYTYGDTIVIDGASLGLTTTTNNLTITVGSDWFAQLVAPTTVTGTGFGTAVAGAATWTCPDGVFRVSIVAVGGGGGGASGTNPGGGGGGALAYIQDFTVSPTSTYSFQAGVAGAAATAGGNSSFSMSTSAVATYPSTATGAGLVNNGTGTFLWTCPSGVTSVSVVCVGGGGKGGGGGGGGGGLGWKNNIAVVPGNTYTVVVGGAGTNTTNGGDSYFISATTVKGGGGSSATSSLGLTNTAGGTYVGDGGGNGGAGSVSTLWGGGGGGAGGYTGNGGNAATLSGSPGSGGGGGGGAGHSDTDSNDAKRKGGGGGGVGILGQGTSGNGATATTFGGDGGFGGSGGGNGIQSDTTNGGGGGTYGAGSGGTNDTTGGFSGTPGSGAVRIIWGAGRSFPNNAGDTADTILVGATGGSAGTSGAGGAGGTVTGGTGFSGGAGGASATLGGGGGGAGGYSAAGGVGGSSSGVSPNLQSRSGINSISGGGGGSTGGGGGGLNQDGTVNNSTTGNGGGGGGVALLGSSNLGIGGVNLTGTTGAILGQSGTGGSGGATGGAASATVGGAGGAQGGGGGGGTTTGGAGAAGAIRIIWNYPHAFLPSTTDLKPIGNTVLLATKSYEVVDTTGNNIISDIFGATPNTTTIPFSNTYSYQFNGTTQYLQIAHSSDFVFGSGDFTVEGWFYTTVTTSDKGVFYKRSNYSGVNFGTSSQAANRLMVLVSNDTGTAWTVLDGSTVAFVINTWYHFAITKTNGNVYFYLNGTLRTTNPHTTSIYDDGSPVMIGQNGQGGGFWQGYLSNIRVIKGTAIYSPSLYPSGFTPSTVPLSVITNTKLLTLQSSGIFDATGINTIISVPVGYGNNTTIPFSTTWSTQFNGTSQYLSIPHNSNFVFGNGVDFTIEGFVYTSATTINKGIYYKRANSSAISGVNFGTSTTTASRFQLRVANADGSVWTINDATAGTFAINTWYHFAITKTNGVIYLYINGLLIRQYAHTTAIYDDGSPLNIGQDPGGAKWVGYISNIRVVRGTAAYYPPSTIINRNYPNYPPVIQNSGLLNFADAIAEYPNVIGGAGIGLTNISNGVFTWTCPDRVYNVNIVCVGGGGAGGSSGSGNGATIGYAGGGGGGALAYLNNYPVVPGKTYNIVAGRPGVSDSYDGGDSYFIDTSTILATGGKNGQSRASAETGYKSGGAGGTYSGVGVLGGNGGAGGSSPGGPYYGPGSGGGAGGYSGNGGNGGNGSDGGVNNVSTVGISGSGGGAAGGPPSGTAPGNGGGGVGLFGEGASGVSYTYTEAHTAGGVDHGGQGGSGGDNGTDWLSISSAPGGKYGGGGAGGYGGVYTAGYNGGVGAVRISWSPTTFSLPLSQDISQEGVQDIKLQIRTGSTSGPIVATAPTVLVADTSRPLALPGGGQCWCVYPDYVSGPNLVYTGTLGQFTFTAPKGYTTVSVVCIGGGGMGTSNGGGGGGGGALAYIASFTVTPGTTYTVVAGYGGDSSNQYTGDANGGASSFNTTTVIANGGSSSGTTTGGAGGTVGAGTGFAGGAGGAGAGTYSGGGGGGAGGYTVAGGVGGSVTGTYPTLTAGSGAASTTGGAGGSAGGSATAGPYFAVGGGGGGTSPFGSVAVASIAGTSYAGLQSSPGRGGGGSGGVATTTASGVQLGQRGYTGASNQPPNGGAYGGGGGGGDGNSNPGGAGGPGCVRIIWGTGRAYPATLTADRVSGFPAAVGNPAGQQ